MLLNELDRADIYQPDDARLEGIRMDAELAQCRFDMADKLVADLDKKRSKTAAVYALQADLKARHGEFDKARKILDDAQAKLGDDCELRIARALLALRATWAMKPERNSRNSPQTSIVSRPRTRSICSAPCSPT